jgi:NAD(P)-dependent dehydrogenase (short-subunit alcohol dehydrogenase family)
VVGLARTESALDELGNELRGLGTDYLSVPADLRDLASIQAAVALAWEWRPINVLVNAAGTIVRGNPLEMEPESWDEVFEINLRGAFFLTQAVARKMLDGAGGNVVNITSVAGEVTTGASVSYSASKAALIHMTRVLAVNWAPTIRVNAVGPAYIRTSLNEEWLAKAENEKFVLDRTPLGRVGEPSDVVGAVTFLASEESSYVTGHHLLVDGGWTAQ